MRLNLIGVEDMRYGIYIVFVLSVVLLLLLPKSTFAVVCKADFYVSPSGNDSWSGKLPAPNAQRTDGPFESLERARDAIRRLKKADGLPAGGVTVCARGGAYTITKTFELTAADGGAADAPVIYEACEGEGVRLIGGKRIEGFAPTDDQAVLRRINEACRGKILQVNLRRQGITDFGQLKPRGFGRPMYAAGIELFFDDRPMQLARWPNRGWAKIAAVPAGKQAGRFTYEGDRPTKWAAADDVWLHGYWTQDWADSYVKVKSIDIERKEITTHEPHGVYGYTAGKRYCALNILEELDEPGEWYLDRKSGVLYFWPPAPVNEAKAFVSILEEPMISMRDVSHVRLEGFTLECTRGSGIEMSGGTGNVIARCVLRNIGNVAVKINGGMKNGVVGCDVYETGDGGISLSGGDRKKLTPAGNYARNNHIHNYSRWVRTYRAAIRVSGVGNHVAHNLIHDAPHTGILFGGNDHLFEFNEVHNVCRETGDVGAFYTGRNWTTRGTVIRYNYFHDIYGPYTHGAMAVYLDDAASGSTIFGNVFLRRAGQPSSAADVTTSSRTTSSLIVSRLFTSTPAAWAGQKNTSRKEVAGTCIGSWRR